MMTVIYDTATGDIRRRVVCSRAEDIAANTGEGEAAIEITDPAIDELTHHVVAGEVTPNE
jgi:hypothetical protein